MAEPRPLGEYVEIVRKLWLTPLAQHRKRNEIDEVRRLRELWEKMYGIGNTGRES